MSHLSATQNFRRTARRCLAIGLILACLSLGISCALEGAKAAGLAWGGGAGLLLSLVTAAILYIPLGPLPTAGRLRGHDRLYAQSAGDDSAA